MQLHTTQMPQQSVRIATPASMQINAAHITHAAHKTQAKIILYMEHTNLPRRPP